MTDEPSAPAAPPAPVRAIPWSNVVCLALGVATVIAELVAVSVYKADANMVHGFGDAILLGCALAYDAKAGAR